MTPQPTTPIIAVVGATAAGKSELALDLAERLGGEIINTDAMQVYRGMDIGTAKLPPAERRGIPHHLLDLLDVSETASVAVFQRLARDAIAEIRRRGRTPVLVGGSALYVRAVLDDLDFPGTDPQVRARWQQQLDETGPEALHRLLAEQNPEAAAAIEPLNGRRIVRALEVIELTGSFRATIPEPAYVDPASVQIGVDLDRPTLDARIERRVARMWADGLLEEVRSLPGLADSPTASRAIGYRQALDQLAGQIDEAEAQRRTVVATRRFVRRQDAWFRKDDRVRWVAPGDIDAAQEAL